LVWVNPLTGEKAFQVHGMCARKLYLRNSQEEEPRVIDEVSEIVKFLLDIQNRVLKPEYVLLAPVEEGDMVIWDNYGLFHSAIDYPISMGPRSMHQANISGSVGPKGPVPIPLTA
jgi:alpha-ketoglutarate-dependent taurine dioxygenase